MKTATFLLSAWLLSSAVSADVTRNNDRVILTYSFSEDTVIQRALGYGYMTHECRSVPSACGICSKTDNKTQCEAKVAAATPESLDAALPTVTRLVSGEQREVCTGPESAETPEECEAKISTDAGAIGLAKGHCGFIVDPDNVTASEWQACEQRAAERGLVPAASVDVLPHFQGSLNFLHEKAGRPIQQARDAGRTMISMEAKAQVDLTEDP